MGYIYIFTFPNGKKYIGQTNNLKNRYRCHKKDNQLVDRAIRKVGWENVLRNEMECSEELLDETEKIWIKNFDTLHPKGYNLESGGNRNKHLSKKTKEMISKSKKGKNYGMIGENHPMFGKHHTSEAKKRISKAQKGKILSKTTKEKMSKNRIKKSIFQFSKESQFIKQWNSAIQIEKELGFSHQHIGKVCMGKRKTAYGFIWKFGL
jgi:group I intron endonuclease